MGALIGEAARSALVRRVRLEMAKQGLTREALAGKPVPSLAATIYHGRAGTPMPGWRSLLSETEAHWIAEQLVNGFPETAK